MSLQEDGGEKKIFYHDRMRNKRRGEMNNETVGNSCLFYLLLSLFSL
jgi:hypothetical protein